MPPKHTQSRKGRKRKGKDIDEIHDDLKPKKATKLLNQEVDLDLPGEGQFYCIECVRHFADAPTLSLHQKSKLHKQQLRRLKEVPYTIAEAEAAGGVGVVPFIKNLTPAEVTRINKNTRTQKMDEYST
ncbi:unnamed protein product, partial [Mesorhabditis belari]|uniref:Zinc finger protein 593 homolog n=1 Tax=Mesorhabditis belari TaxID=2138241 RepID=A0AAF3FN47_9BILA